MSLQWVSAAAFLYAELALGVLLCLPFISCQRWQSVFNSRLLGILKRYGNFYFSAFVLILFVLFLDSAHQMRKYGDADMTADNNVLSGGQKHMKLFRAQRNCYISGFSLFMLVVLRRLTTLISRTATVEASHEAVKRQAEGASNQCRKLLDENSSLKESSKGNESGSEVKKNLDKSVDSANALGKELEKTKKDLEAMKTQAKGLTTEYDRVVAENEKLEKRLAQSEGNVHSKKDD